MNLMVPADDGIKYPTLGPQIVDWMQEHLVFGPGDLRGSPLVLDGEQQAFLWKLYELFPKDHPHAGRRRFRRCALSLAKGLRKTELAACIAAAELHPDAPVRFNGWKGRGLATGHGVTDPFVILVAYTEEQSDELAYGALKAILEESPIAGDFDIGLERILRITGGGKAVSLSGSPNARDGARTTFQCFDETHRHVLPRLKQAHQTMQANLAKRPSAEPWTLEITTAPEPGAGSVAEATMEYAKAVQDGRVQDADLFFFHRQASDSHDLTTKEGARAAVIEASGASASWRDIDAIVGLWNDPTTDRTYWERVWTNRMVQSSSQAFDIPLWQSLARAESPVQEGDTIVIGFDGSQFHDATAIACAHVKSGFLWTAGLWECPFGRTDWEVPVAEVDAVIDDLFRRFNVWRLYADPFFWETRVAAWAGTYGQDKILEWRTNRQAPMTQAIRAFETAMRDRTLSHDGDPALTRHLGNARKQELVQRDEQGRRYFLIRKDRPNSPLKMDLAMAAVLAHRARLDAVEAGLAGDEAFSLHIFGGRPPQGRRR